MAYIKTIISLLFVAFMAQANAQRVGVVLSGGGAKGLYHIGVIQALEENGIPIDYISGTSMGSIIGGLYAIGYSPKEMADIFRSDQIKYWMSGKIEEQYIYYFKQKSPNASMINIDLDFANPHRIAQLPTNLISSNQIDVGFIEYFSTPEAQSDGNFDNLFVPFRCIATDAAARREVVYRDGNLGRAIRASMTIPLVFRPLKGDSTLLYDGGIYNNFPWQVLQEDFAPEILIGSKCTQGNVKPDENNVVDQILSLTMMNTDYNLPGDNDILLERALEDVSMLDFSRPDYVINQGYIDALAAMPTIKERIKRRVTPEELAARRLVYRSRLPALEFNRYEIEGLSSKQTEYVTKMMRLDRPTKNQIANTFSFERFKSEYFKVLSDGDIEGGYPMVRMNDTTRLFAVALDLRTKPGTTVRFGGNISSTSMNQAYIGVEYRRIGKSAHTYNLDGYFSALYTSVSATSRTDFYLKRSFAFDYGYNYNYYNYFRSNTGTLVKHNDLTYSKYGDSYLTAGLSIPLDRYTKMSLRTNLGRDKYGYYQSAQHDDADEMDHTRFSFVGLQLEVDRNSLNYLIYPTRGIMQSASALYITGSDKLSAANGSVSLPSAVRGDRRSWFGAQFIRENYFPIAKWFTLGYMAQLVVTSHPSFHNEYTTNLTSPAFTPTPHSKLVYIKDFRSGSFIGVGTMPIFEFSSKFYLKNSVYAFIPNDANEVKENIKKRVRYMFNSSLVYQTPVGPVSLTLAKYDATSNQNWFLTFNFGYTIFNRKGLFY